MSESMKSGDLEPQPIEEYLVAMMEQVYAMREDGRQKEAEVPLDLALEALDQEVAKMNGAGILAKAEELAQAALTLGAGPLLAFAIKLQAAARTRDPSLIETSFRHLQEECTRVKVFLRQKAG